MQAVDALAAVALGGTIAAATQLVTSWITARRDDRARSHATRAELYAEYCSLMFELTDSVRSIKFLDPATDPIPDLPLEAFEARARSLLARMNLVASSAVLTACHETSQSIIGHLSVLKAVASLERAVVELDDAELLERVTSAREILEGVPQEGGVSAQQAYRKMVTAMRRDLGNSKRLRKTVIVGSELTEQPPPNLLDQDV